MYRNNRKGGLLDRANREFEEARPYIGVSEVSYWYWVFSLQRATGDSTAPLRRRLAQVKWPDPACGPYRMLTLRQWKQLSLPRLEMLSQGKALAVIVGFYFSTVKFVRPSSGDPAIVQPAHDLAMLQCK